MPFALEAVDGGGGFRLSHWPVTRDRGVSDR
jgi:hypothetical protein